jgi:hypothetical protein
MVKQNHLPLQATQNKDFTEGVRHHQYHRRHLTPSSGIYQSSALSLERLRNHQSSQQYMLDEAAQTRKIAVEQLSILKN